VLQIQKKIDKIDMLFSFIFLKESSLGIYVLQHKERNIKVILIFGKLLQMYELSKKKL